MKTLPTAITVSYLALAAVFGSADSSEAGCVQSVNSDAKHNTCIGSDTLFYNTGNYNTATGFHGLVNNNTGNSNTANGAFALTANLTGSSNTAVGASALTSNNSGNLNTAVGSGGLL